MYWLEYLFLYLKFFSEEYNRGRLKNVSGPNALNKVEATNTNFVPIVSRLFRSGLFLVWKKLSGVSRSKSKIMTMARQAMVIWNVFKLLDILLALVLYLVVCIVECDSDFWNWFLGILLTCKGQSRVSFMYSWRWHASWHDICDHYDLYQLTGFD